MYLKCMHGMERHILYINGTMSRTLSLLLLRKSNFMKSNLLENTGIFMNIRPKKIDWVYLDITEILITM